jgi:hypothetical protein
MNHGFNGIDDNGFVSGKDYPTTINAGTGSFPARCSQPVVEKMVRDEREARRQICRRASEEFIAKKASAERSRHIIW